MAFHAKPFSKRYYSAFDKVRITAETVNDFLYFIAVNHHQIITINFICFILYIYL